mmetsp:Transcript_25234/g.59506  ORF Transcript_25234/g.59506 Transcript_25234/m.59506 type:complete len:153 (-) Transcript_25234:1380-1838(-)
MRGTTMGSNSNPPSNPNHMQKASRAPQENLFPKAKRVGSPVLTRAVLSITVSMNAAEVKATMRRISYAGSQSKVRSMTGFGSRPTLWEMVTMTDSNRNNNIKITTAENFTNDRPNRMHSSVNQIIVVMAPPSLPRRLNRPGTISSESSYFDR